LNGGRIVYEDPAAALNVSEEAWHKIVQDNLKRHKETEITVKREKFIKNKAIQDEQRRQVEIKRAE